MGLVSRAEGRRGEEGCGAWSCRLYLMASWLCGRMQDGGGLYFDGGSSAMLSDCSISGNSADWVSALFRRHGLARARPPAVRGRTLCRVGSRCAPRRWGVWRQLREWITSATRIGGCMWVVYSLRWE